MILPFFFPLFTNVYSDDIMGAIDHLIYWPEIPGRGEPIRLLLEEAAAEYVDTPGGMDELMKYVNEEFADESTKSPHPPPPHDIRSVPTGLWMSIWLIQRVTCVEGNPPPLAPPILKVGDVLLSQVR